MNKAEKIGLLLFQFGLVALIALFIMGDGNVASVIVNGENKDFIFPLISFVFGALLFVLL